jgi:[ribosomal protein S18]-alanine N-acetyltransferase
MSAVLKAQWRIEALRMDDIDEIVVIEKSVYDFPWTAGNFRDSVKAEYSCWTYRNPSDELVGYGVLMFGVDEAHLLNLSIGKEFQRRGHGAHLLEHFVRVAQGHEAKLMFLEVRPTNLAGRRLYERYGFKHVGTRKAYYPSFSGREDALVLSRSLRSA